MRHRQGQAPGGWLGVQAGGSRPGLMLWKETERSKWGPYSGKQQEDTQRLHERGSNVKERLKVLPAVTLKDEANEENLIHCVSFLLKIFTGTKLDPGSPD